MKTLEEKLRERYEDYLARVVHPFPLSYDEWCRQSRVASQIRLTHHNPKPSGDMDGVSYQSPIGRRSKWD
jgi:hypothetical protein